MQVHSWLYVLRFVYLKHTVSRPACFPPFIHNNNILQLAHAMCRRENAKTRERTEHKNPNIKTSLLVVQLSCAHKYSDMYENKRESTLNHAFGSREGRRRQKISRTRIIAREKLSSVFGQTSKRQQVKSSKQLKTLLSSTTKRSGEKKWKNICSRH